MPITIRDIAKKLNLSIAAVSRALDGYPDISEETRQRVIDAAREMGYVPNRAARQLRRQKSDAIGYILSSDTPRLPFLFSRNSFPAWAMSLPCTPSTCSSPLLLRAQKRNKLSTTPGRNRRKVDGFILDQIRTQDWRVRFLTEHSIPYRWVGTFIGWYRLPPCGS